MEILVGCEYVAVLTKKNYIKHFSSKKKYDNNIKEKSLFKTRI